MTLYLVRHAKAGSRRDWDGDDRERPLSKAGIRQAEALATRFVERHRQHPVTALLSSSYVRCAQTLEPLAGALGMKVDIDSRLTEGAAFEDALELLEEATDGTVMCSHGDVVPDVMAALQRRGCRLHGQPDWRKATVWVIERDDGTFTDARVWAPPE